MVADQSSKAKDTNIMTTTSKTLTTSLMAGFFALAFSTALLLGAIGPAINVAPTATTQDYVA